MSASTTMTIRVSPEVKAKLDRIAIDTRRSRSYLAAEAVEAYVERELAIIESIKRGITDADAGMVVPHDVAIDEIYDVIQRTEANRSGKA